MNQGEDSTTTQRATHLSQDRVVAWRRALVSCRVEIAFVRRERLAYGDAGHEHAPHLLAPFVDLRPMRRAHARAVVMARQK